jgi:BACON domain-containing protein/peptidase M66-like protein
LVVSLSFRVCALLLCSWLLMACGSGSSSGSSTEPVNNPPATQSAAPELSNLNPVSISRTLDAGTSADINISFANTGDGDLSYEVRETEDWITLSGSVAGTLTANTATSTLVGVTCGTANLSGAITITTNDADESSVIVPVELTCVAAAANVEIARVTLNQGARGYDSAVSPAADMSVLAGRELLVRVFLTGTGQSPEVRVVLSTPGLADVTLPLQTPVSISDTQADESLLGASHYAVVPGGTLRERTEMRIEVAPFANPVTFPVNGNFDLDVVDPGPLEVTFVPVTFQGQTPDINPDVYMSQALKVLPVGALDVQVRTPYVFTDSYDLAELLTQLADLRDLDGSNRLYHGIIIPPSGSNSNTAGVGYVGFPVSVSVDLGGAGYVIAHEIGHNLDLGHAPGCNSPNPDANFPYANGAVTSWGFNVVNNQLVSPAGRRDFMSYCNDLWVSDYHFSKALEYRAQSPIGYGPPSAGQGVGQHVGQHVGQRVSQGLTVSGRVGPNGVSDVRFLPTDTVAMSRLPDQRRADADFEFLAWDANGQALFANNFELFVVEDIDAPAGFSFSVAQPQQPISHFEIRQRGTVIFSAAYPRFSITPTEVSLTWRGDTARIGWSPVSVEAFSGEAFSGEAFSGEAFSGEALIVRNSAGEVLTVNRTGQFEIQNTPGLQITHTKSGSLSRPVSVSAGNSGVLQLNR